MPLVALGGSCPTSATCLPLDKTSCPVQVRAVVSVSGSRTFPLVRELKHGGKGSTFRPGPNPSSSGPCFSPRAMRPGRFSQQLDQPQF